MVAVFVSSAESNTATRNPRGLNTKGRPLVRSMGQMSSGRLEASAVLGGMRRGSEAGVSVAADIGQVARAEPVAGGAPTGWRWASSTWAMSATIEAKSL